ncbi:MAG: hypothetical protein ACQEUB_13450 [Thermodesulfobacteriota bacterium]
MNVTIDRLLDGFHSLDMEDKEYVAQIINKLLAESRRDYLAARASEAKENYKAGQCKSGSLQDLIKDLEDD